MMYTLPLAQTRSLIILLTVLIMLITSFGASGQCNHIVSISSTGSSCAGRDTLSLSGVSKASRIVWASAVVTLTIDSAGGSIDTIYVPTAPGTYIAYVTLQNGCRDTSSAIIVQALLTPAVSISSPSDTICAGTTAIFSTHPVNGGTPVYQWYVNGITAASADTFADNTINDGDNIWVVMTATGCTTVDTAMSGVIHMIVLPSLTPSISVVALNSADTICQNMVVNLFAIGLNAGINADYQWQLNGINVGNSETYIANPIHSGDTFRCIITSAAVCYTQLRATSNSLTFTVHPYPTVSAAPTEGIAPCTGDSTNLTATGGIHYQWSNGDTSSTVWVTTGSYTVTATDIYGCTAGSVPLSVSTHTPLKDSLSIIGDTLSIASATGQFYQWYYNDSIINGAIGSSYIASHSGSYQLSVIDSFGCKTSSAYVSIFQTGINIIDSKSIQLYPNPGRGLYTITLNDDETHFGYLSDGLGRSIIDKIEIRSHRMLDLSALSTGIYFLHIGTETLRILLEK